MYFEGLQSETPIFLRAELRDTFKLAAPIVLNQVGHMSMGIVDTLAAGRIGTTELAGLGLASNFYWTFTSVCLGFLLALDTYFSQAVGAKDESALRRFFGQSFWSSAIVTFLATSGVLLGYALYLTFASPGGVREAFTIYLRYIIWCTPAIFVFFVIQRYWQACHVVVPFSIILILANVLNLLACLALGLGHWGFPKLGVQGLAWATLISRYAMLAAAIAFTAWKLRPEEWRPHRLDWPIQRLIFQLGLPAAGQIGLEVGAFTIAAFAAGLLGAVPLAAHHISLMMAACTFMVPLGMSAAAAVRVGNFVGAAQPERAQLAGWLCIAVSIGIMGGFALVYLAIPRTLLGCFTQDPAVIDLGARILVFVALFQVADGIQVSTTGALRGVGNTRDPMLANLVGHYPIGLLLGLGLCFGLKLGAVGLWGGLAAGLISVATILIRVWIRATRRKHRWTRVEAKLA